MARKNETFFQRQRRLLKERRARTSNSNKVENTTKPPTITRTDNKRDARRAFFNEMKHEGYRLTSLGRKMERKSYKQSRTGSEYRRMTMKYFSGNKSQEGKYWIKKRKATKSKGDSEKVEVIDRQVAVGQKYQFTKAEEREKYLKEMAHEGYELTPAGKAEMKRAFAESNNPAEFRRIVYAFIKFGDKYVVKTSKKGSANMEMAAEYCSRDSGTKAGDWFARY